MWSICGNRPQKNDSLFCFIRSNFCMWLSLFHNFIWVVSTLTHIQWYIQGRAPSLGCLFFLSPYNSPDGISRYVSNISAKILCDFLLAVAFAYVYMCVSQTKHKTVLIIRPRRSVTHSSARRTDLRTEWPDPSHRESDKHDELSLPPHRPNTLNRKRVKPFRFCFGRILFTSTVQLFRMCPCSMCPVQNRIEWAKIARKNWGAAWAKVSESVCLV